jgi:5'-methylthioadenosine phosphorylase
MFGIIGGTGLASIHALEILKREIIRTPYGEPSHPLIFGSLSNKNIVFLARHGSGHTIPPHEINYRANIWALQSVGVTKIISIATVGVIDEAVNPGTICIPNQIIDYTYGRKNTYFDGAEMPVKHIDFTYPYDESLRKQIITAAKTVLNTVVTEGVYAAVQGPRLETAAEINRLEKDGANIVGMTGMPEAALAKELNIAYAAICPMVNHAAGRGQSKDAISFSSINELCDNDICQLMMNDVIRLIQTIISKD